jgi:hypothetical protein
MNKKLLKLHIENATPKRYCFYEILKLNAETILFLMFCIFLYIVFFIIFWYRNETSYRLVYILKTILLACNPLKSLLNN